MGVSSAIGSAACINSRKFAVESVGGAATPRSETDSVEVDRALLERLTDALCYAA